MRTRKIRLAIIHFNPIEKYPPILNWLDFLSETKYEELRTIVFTISADKSFKKYKSKIASVKISRSIGLVKNSFIRRSQYLLFYFSTIWKLIWFRPQIVFYYETLSAIPAIFYKTFICRNASIVLHYHEYTSPEEYQNGMFIEKWAHRWEQINYKKYKWISHTNNERLNLFSRDNSKTQLPLQYVFPNYPPLSWKKNNPRKFDSSNLKFVLVGAADLETMYIKEFAEWVLNMDGKASWDIYTSNITPSTISYINNLNSEYIRIKGPVPYTKLPEILLQYNIGLILYKGKIKNFIYNAPNKLFEYYACGLDVWFPMQMISSYPYITKNTFPKIVAIEFENMQQADINKTIDRKTNTYLPSKFYADIVHFEMYRSLITSYSN